MQRRNMPLGPTEGFLTGEMKPEGYVGEFSWLMPQPRLGTQPRPGYALYDRRLYMPIPILGALEQIGKVQFYAEPELLGLPKEFTLTDFERTGPEEKRGFKESIGQQALDAVLLSLRTGQSLERHRVIVTPQELAKMERHRAATVSDVDVAIQLLLGEPLSDR